LLIKKASVLNKRTLPSKVETFAQVSSFQLTYANFLGQGPWGGKGASSGYLS